MNIAILTSYFYHEVKEIHGKDRIIFGGGERYLIDLCHTLQAAGHDVVVYQPLDNIVRIDGATKRVQCNQINRNFMGVPIICIPDTDTWKFSTNATLSMIFNEIASMYDLRIYFATFLAFPFVVRPAISISHGIFWDYPQHQIRTWGEIDKKEFFRRQMYGFTAPDVCVSVDSNVKKVIAAMDPGCEDHIEIIYNYVDTEKFVPAEKTWDGINVLYPRRLTTLRGCNDFIKATKDFPHYMYTAVGQSANEDAGKQMVAWGNTTPHVKFIDKEMGEMAEVYQNSDISVVPTKGSEGLSLSLLESMACGLPVITTPVGGLGDAVIDGYNGLIYDPHHEHLGDYIDFLAKDEALRHKFGRRNREIAVEAFDIKIWQRKWLELVGRFGG